MKIRLRNSAIKDLKMLSQTDKQRIHGKIMELENFPHVSNLKKLTNFEPAYRAKVGDYRILFDVLDETIEIGRVLHRKESYRKQR
jgi:mRNA interferase RelE/StbE